MPWLSSDSAMLSTTHERPALPHHREDTKKQLIVMAENTTFTVAKSSVELYKIRHASGCYWADITIDASGHTGRISIASDWGNWSNYWGACGSDFKTFLASLNHDYVASKFGAEQWVDVEKSLGEFKKMVSSYEQHGHLSKEEALLIRSEIKDLRGEPSLAISQAIEHTEYLSRFLYANAGEADYIYKDNPHFRAFWDNAWPIMLAEFARETAVSATIEKTPTL
jgi:hypothetical protein